MASLASQSDLILYAGGNTYDVPDSIDIEEEVLQLSQSLAQEQLEELWNVEPSLYVKIVSEALFKIPITEEKDLFSLAETEMIIAFEELTYESKFLLVRYALRKHQWYRQSTITTTYRSEIGDKAKVCVKELTRRIFPGKTSGIKEEEPEIVDLSSDPGFSFCLGEDALTLQEALDILTIDELKSLSRDFKLSAAGTRDVLVSNLLNSSEKQTAITGFFASAAKTTPRNKKSINTQSPVKMRQTTLPFASPSKNSFKSSQNRLLTRARVMLGTCIKIKPEVLNLFTKAHLIFFRSTSLPDSLMLPALLASFKKRNHPQIEATRSAMLIWPSSHIFDQYWNALRVLHEIEGIRNYTDPIFKPTKPKVSHNYKFKQRATEEPEVSPADPKSLVAARKVWAIVKTIIPQWWNMVLHRKLKTEDNSADRTGLERFEPGYILTRVVQRGADACGRLKKFHEEVRILNALVDQSHWRQRKKGEWYDRLALVLTKTWKDIKLQEEADEGSALTDLPPFLYKTQHQATKLAYAAVRRGLSDEKTTRRYIPKLVDRLQRIEKKLKVKDEDKIDISQYRKLKRATESHAEGVRIWDDVPPPGQLNKEGRMINLNKGSSTVMANWIQLPSTASGSNNILEESKSRRRELPWKGKSLWKGRDDSVVNVEEFVIQFYEREGFRGLHAETRILTTLFGILFFDILFAPVNGTFETPYQTAPLDLVEESFYYARKEIIEDRLEELKDIEKAIELLKTVDNRERERKTWCVGVRWEFCTQDDLVEILQCLGGEALSTICRLFAEDYAGRSSGGPDLIVWDIRLRTCRFVEVKGPGDDLMENQKVWIDALLRAGADVQVFHVQEKGTLDRKRKLVETEEDELRKLNATRSRKKIKIEEVKIEKKEEDNENYECLGGDDDEYEPSSKFDDAPKTDKGRVTRSRSTRTPSTPIQSEIKPPRSPDLPSFAVKMEPTSSIQSAASTQSDQLLEEEYAAWS